MRRALLIGIPTLLLIVILVVGLRQAGEDEGNPEDSTTMTRAEVLAPLEGSPPRLAALHAQGSELKPGGTPVYEKHVRALKGYPVVVNHWAAWCAPCRFELPYIQRIASETGKEIAYLGVNVRDSREAAEKTAEEFFMPYPSIEDPRGVVRADFGGQGLPTTVFYDRNGKVEYVHQGAYPSLERLREDVARYTR